MVPIFIFVAGVAVGIGACKFYDVLKNNQDDNGARPLDIPQSQINRYHTQPTERHTANTSSLDISPLENIMKKYGVDISSPNCLYLLCNQIKSSTYKNLLNNIIENTTTGEDLISFINNVHIDTFSFPTANSSLGRYFIPMETIDQLLSESALALDSSEPKMKVETLINWAYASGVARLKKNFGFEFGKLIKAHEEGRDLQTYYNDIIKEIKISRDFMTA